jgi:tripartite-type tricarboxylate transporter receptor subunit TctC
MLKVSFKSVIVQVTLSFALALAFAVALFDAAGAQPAFPSNTIRVFTPFAPGAASDIALRILAEQLSTHLKVPVVVQNQPGGGGVIAGTL